MFPTIACMVTAMRSRDRTTNTEQTGRWISARMEQLGLTQIEIARRLDMSTRAAHSAANGKSAIQRAHRARWEELLGWAPGSLTAAYDDGVEPSLLADNTSSSGDPVADLLADLPEELHDELRQIVAELADLGLNDAEQLRIAQDWVDAEKQIVRLRQDQQRTESKIRALEHKRNLSLVQTAAQQKRSAG